MTNLEEEEERPSKQVIKKMKSIMRKIIFYATLAEISVKCNTEVSHVLSTNTYLTTMEYGGKKNKSLVNLHHQKRELFLIF